MAGSENTTTLPVSRRHLLGRAAAVATVGAAGGTALAVTPQDRDATMLTAFRQWREACTILRADDDNEAADKAEREACDLLADAPVHSAAGAVMKLAFLAYEASDHYGYDDPEHPAVRTMESLKASIPNLPPELATAVSLTVEETAGIMERWSKDCSARYENEKLAKQWKTYDRIFKETNAYDEEEKNRQRSLAEPRGADGLSESDSTFLRYFREVTEEDKRDLVDSMDLMLLGLRVHRALKALAAKNDIAAGSLKILKDDFREADDDGPGTALVAAA
ncbi:hypothetical protein M2352_001810 [Azospirillum fermentarium]|uniref:hypothetical protein n=1 Tax=Azospirillum fermentarium TaxID=1233114 RepID=UPI002226FEB9|nr:hypothetical protein [Azospirillum fermentarium]MCW2246219.1 hypothetical protein [Azospirillum fermentarium]